MTFCVKLHLYTYFFINKFDKSVKYSLFLLFLFSFTCKHIFSFHLIFASLPFPSFLFLLTKHSLSQGELHVRAKVVTGPPWLGKKKSLLFIKFKNFMIFLLLKKYVTTLNFFRLNIIKFWIKFCNKLDCRLKLQLHSIYIYIFYWMWILTNPPLNYIFFHISSMLAELQSKSNSYVINQMFKFWVFVV